MLLQVTKLRKGHYPGWLTINWSAFLISVFKQVTENKYFNKWNANDIYPIF